MLPPRRLVLLGQPVAHSLSPAMHSAALRSAGIDATYETIDVSGADLKARLRELAAAGAAGNVTFPHKERAADLCDVLTPLSARLGAVNTFWTVDGALHGDNTDAGGFDDAIVELLGMLPQNTRVAVLGAGGAARAVVAAIREWHGSSVAIWSRTPARSETLVQLGPTGRTTAEEFMANAIRGADLVVNATPIGMNDDQIPVNPGVLRKSAACLDLVYRRSGPTPFVQLARAQGRRADDGLGMLIGQGARAFERWFGRAADRDAMRLSLHLG